MKIFICPGRLLWSEFEQVLEKTENVEIVGVLANSQSLKKEWTPEKTGYRTWVKEKLVKVDKSLRINQAHEKYEEILEKFMQDSRSYFLLERIYTQGLVVGYDTAFNQSVMMEIAVWNSLAILGETEPDRVIVPSTPHSMTWFLVKTAELMGIDVYLTPESPLKWKRWVVKGLENQKPLNIRKGKHENRNPEKVREYIETLRSSYDEAIPEYERAPLEKFRNKEGSISGEVRTILSQASPRAMLSKTRSALEKREILNLYNNLSENFQFPEKYLVYFLHFQPERTTLPEAGKFVQQWLIIRALSMAIPDDMVLVVKEHPSTFRNHFSKKVRSPHFYNSINSIHNVTLAPLRVTPFELIDRSVAAATCTGTVGVEAAMRGKPVMVFGIAQYRELRNIFEVQTADEIQDAVKKIVNGTGKLTDDEILEYFTRVDENSFEIENLNRFTVEANDLDFSVEAIVEAILYKEDIDVVF
jgi:hypothetical protein